MDLTPYIYDIIKFIIAITLGTILGSYIATEFVVARRLEKRMKKTISNILNDGHFRDEVSKLVDDVLTKVRREGPKIVREIIKEISKGSQVEPPPKK